MNFKSKLLTIPFIVFLWSCSPGDKVVDYSDLAVNTLNEPSEDFNKERNVYFHYNFLRLQTQKSNNIANSYFRLIVRTVILIGSKD